MYFCFNNSTADCSLLFSLHNLNFLSQVLREYDRIHPIYDCQKIVEYWGSLVPTIIEIAKNEDKGEIITLLDGEDDFSDGKHALTLNMVLKNTCLPLFLTSIEYRNIVAICVLYYLVPDPRTVKNHARIVTILEVS